MPVEQFFNMLILNAIIDFLLGFLLVVFPEEVFQLLGLPVEAPAFYAHILGGVLVGIGIALLTERFRSSEGFVGLGLGGAIIINLYGALILAALLVREDLHIPLRGYAVLWGLVLLLIAVSGAELWVHLRKKTNGA